MIAVDRAGGKGVGMKKVGWGNPTDMNVLGMRSWVYSASGASGAVASLAGARVGLAAWRANISLTIGC